EAILALAPPRVRRVVERRLAEDPATPRRIEFGAPVSLGVSTVLGELQATARETFCPLIIRRVYRSWRARGDVESQSFGPTKPAPRPRKPAGRGARRGSPKKGHR